MLKSIIKENSINFNSCKSENEKIKILENILAEHFTPYISMHDAEKNFNIKIHILRYSINCEKIIAIKIGRRTLLKTSTLVPIIFSKNKNLF
ncbi:MAG: hypothetical protein ACRDA0_07910 [Cetobacterium sp.]|uniref:hypothetical protein n=1 Tax=Cetobacterium sp. TaxID=2071632 RepID=UPI003EE540CC